MGTVSWSPTAGDTGTVGAYNFEIQVTWTDRRWQTVPNDSFGSMVIVRTSPTDPACICHGSVLVFPCRSSTDARPTTAGVV